LLEISESNASIHRDLSRSILNHSGAGVQSAKKFGNTRGASNSRNQLQSPNNEIIQQIERIDLRLDQLESKMEH
jgi:hypothetical protein